MPITIKKHEDGGQPDGSAVKLSFADSEFDKFFSGMPAEM